MKWKNIDISAASLGGIIKIKICSKELYEHIVHKLAEGMTGAECNKLFAELTANAVNCKLSTAEKKRVIRQYCNSVNQIVEDNGQELKIPHCVAMDAEGHSCALECHTVAVKLAADYTGCSIPEIEQMSYLEFKYWAAEAAKFNLSSSEKGREMLNQAYDEMFVPFDRDAFLRGGK